MSRRYSGYISLAVAFSMMIIITACSKPNTSSAASTDDSEQNRAELIQKGKDLYQNSASGNGCQLCHGVDGKGRPNLAPAILGEDAEDIKEALRLQPMNIINLTGAEIDAIAEYLGYLETQP